MEKTTNYLKHTDANPVQRRLIARFHDRLLSCIREARPRTLLDAGCGEGFTMKLIREAGLCPDITGIDYSETAIRIAHIENPSLVIKKGSVYGLPFADGSFDLVLCSEVLEHLTDPGNAVEELKRVSKKHILVSVPNEPYFMTANFLRGKYLSRLGNHPEHIQHWTAGGIQSFLESAGLTVRNVYHPFAWTIILAVR